MISLKNILKKLIQEQKFVTTVYDRDIDKTPPFNPTQDAAYRAELANPDTTEARKREIRKIMIPSWYRWTRSKVFSDKRWSKLLNKFSDDIMGLALMGLERAFDEIDWTRGVPLGPYAYSNQIQRALTNFKNENERTVRRPADQYNQYFADVDLDEPMPGQDADDKTTSRYDIMAADDFEDVDQSTLDRIRDAYKTYVSMIKKPWKKTVADYYLFDENGKLRAPDERPSGRQIHRDLEDELGINFTSVQNELRVINSTIDEINDQLLRNKKRK